MKPFQKLTLVLVSQLTLLGSVWASDPNTVEIYNGHQGVRVVRQAEGMYALEKPLFHLKYLTTANYSYGIPFIVLDTRTNDIVFDRVDNGGDPRVRFWRIGRGEEPVWVGLQQASRATSSPGRCPIPGDRASPAIIIHNEFNGQDPFGNTYEVSETYAQPKAFCDLDRASYRIRMLPAPDELSAASKLEAVSGNLLRSLSELFDLSPDDLTLETELISAGSPSLSAH